MSVAYVMFDLYGTLVDWVKSIGSFIEKFVSSEAVENFFKCDIEQVSSDTYKPYKDILKECLRRASLKYNVSLSSNLEEAFVLHFAKSPPFPDMIYGIKLLRASGLRVGVLSNTDKYLAKITLCGLELLLDFMITAEDVKAYKSRREAFLRAYSMLGVAPREVVHVSAYAQYDLEPASWLGARTVLVDRGYGYKWHVSVKSLVELMDVLEGMTKP